MPARPALLSRLLMVAMLALAAVGSAASTPSELTFGTRTLPVPEPSGFTAASSLRPDVMPVMQSFLPPGNRLVEMYVADADVAAFRSGTSGDLETYFLLQTLRSTDGIVISGADFAQQTTAMEREFEATFPNIDRTGAELTARGNQSVKDLTGSDPDISLDGTQYLGISRREPWGLFFDMRSTLSSGSGDARDRVTMAASGALVLINHQLMFLYSYRRFDDAEDLAWSRSAVSRWADAVRAANPDDAALESNARKFGLDWSEVLTGAARGAAIGALIGLIFWIVRGRRKT